MSAKEEIVDLLLHSKYFKEFEIIDGIKQHPNGYSFEQWKEKIK